MIRSTQHSLKFANTGKLAELAEFVDEYRRVGQLIVNEIWENGYESFNVKTDNLEFPLFIDYKKFPIETLLSARALSSLTTQVSGVIRSAVKKRAKTIYVLGKKKERGEDVSRLEHRLKTQLKISKPSFEKNDAELSSKCAEIRKEGKFGWYLRVKSTGFKSFNLPIQQQERSLYWEKQGRLMGSFLVSKGKVQLRFEVAPKQSLGTKTVGVDQGMKTVATLSDGSVTPDKCIHGHSFDSICDKLARKQKGSQAFIRATRHRKNHLNWALNQINWSSLKEVRLEKIVNINFGKNTSRKLKHFTNTLIRDKIKSSCEELGVLVVEQDSTYRSQRCSSCGIVRKANRKGKVYECKHCGLNLDSDLNASRNHLADLPFLDWTIRGQKFNLGNGFYWNPSGITTFDGRELRVPDSVTKG